MARARLSISFCQTGIEVNRNDVLNGNIYGKLTYSNLLPQFTPVNGTAVVKDLSAVSGEAPQPTILFAGELTSDHYCDLVLVQGLTLVRESGVFAVVGENRVRLWNKFQIKTPKISLPSNITDKYYDVTAIYGTDVVNGNVVDEFYVLNSPVEGLDPDAIKTIPADEKVAGFSYNLAGQRVGKDYKGIVVKDGKKFFQK